MQTVDIPIAQLTSLENNPRRITKDQMAKLEKSLKDDPGFLKCRPILVNAYTDEQGNVINQVYAGNQRVKAAKKLKWKSVPCLVEIGLNDDLMKSRAIKDNKTYGEFDFDILGNEWDTELLLDCGFTESQLHLDLQVNEVPTKEKKEKSKKCCPSCGHEF